MKKVFNYFVVICIIAAFLFAFDGLYKINQAVNVNNYSSRYTVVIDAGHGGKDCGTIGIDGTEEKQINLSIALALRDYLSVCGIKTVMVREGDYEIYPQGSDKNRSDLYNRLDFINSIPNAIMVSIHQNHYSDESEWGTQIWYSVNDAFSKHLADSILTNVKSLLQSDNERVNKATDSNYYILYKATVPSIMIECGFMSNKSENGKLKNSDYQKKFAYSVLTGICGEI